MSETATTPRVVTITVTPENALLLQVTTGTEEYFRALGYLSQWNLNYPAVAIHCIDTECPELLAIYTREDGTRGYAIGAVWNGSRFGFHS